MDGIAGFRYNDETYLFRKNVQGDITHIYTVDGELVAKYVYDAWGNHKVLAVRKEDNAEDSSFIGNVNPFRYRGYYFDNETGLYYLQSRYYDPQTSRFISADSIDYLDPETLGGLNLYAYCNNNPVMAVDPEGNKVKWWQWLLFGIGAVLVVAAAITLILASCGMATGLVGAIFVGAAKGALIGAAVGSAIGIAGGAYYAYKTGSDYGESILSGFLMGFGIGAIVGAVIGGVAGGVNFHLNAPTPSGLSRKAINEGVKNFFANENNVNHLMQSKHNLPNSLRALRNLMKNTLINGQVGPYKGVSSAFWKVVGSEVTFKIIDELIRISDMWIRR